MNLFKRKKSKKQEELEEFKQLKNTFMGGAIRIEDKIIRPVFNKRVERKIAEAVIRGTKIKKGFIKYMCMRHSDMAVYQALKEGAKQSGIPFKYSMIELFYVIDYTDYVNVLTEIQKNIELGLKENRFNQN